MFMALPPKRELEKLLGAMTLGGKLKDVPRTGWVRQKVRNPESVAGHSFRTALLCYYFAPYAGVDPRDAAVMGLIHDWHESICGDIATRPSGVVGMTLGEKRRRESKAVLKLAALLPFAQRAEYKKLYRTAHVQSSALGAFVKDMDYVEMALTALEYEKAKRAPKGKLDEFFESVKPGGNKGVRTPLGKALYRAVLARRVRR